MAWELDEQMDGLGVPHNIESNTKLKDLVAYLWFQCKQKHSVRGLFILTSSM